MRKFRAFLADVSRHDFWIGLALALVTVGIIVGTAIGTAKIDESQLAITCQIARSSSDQLAALREISDRLGIPVTFTIPEEPAECDGH